MDATATAEGVVYGARARRRRRKQSSRQGILVILLYVCGRV
jgi:hypothetical protein